MRRLEATSTYTNDEINHLARRGKQRGHILGVGRVLPTRVTASPSRPTPESTLKSLHKKVDFMMSLFKSDSKFSDAFSQFESAGASGSGRSGGCEDDEESVDDQEDEDEDGNGDGDNDSDDDDVSFNDEEAGSDNMNGDNDDDDAGDDLDEMLDNIGQGTWGDKWKTSAKSL
ncbi:hypothetical protein Tco_1540104 [Tanacetum coccineum]